MTEIDEIFQDQPAPDRSPAGPKIMVIDDNRELSEAIRLTLQDEYRVVTCSSLAEALDQLTPDIELILLDIQMALHDGIECFRVIRENRPDIKIIFNTAYAGSMKKARTAENLDHDGFLYKGDYSGRRLTGMIREALKQTPAVA